MHATHHGLEFEAIPFHFPKPCFRLLAHQTGEIHPHGVDGLNHSSAASLMASLEKQAAKMGRDAFFDRWSNSTAQAYEVEVLAIESGGTDQCEVGSLIVLSASPGKAGKADAQHVAFLSLWDSRLDSTCSPGFIVEKICDEALVCRSELDMLPQARRPVRP